MMTGHTSLTLNTVTGGHSRTVVTLSAVCECVFLLFDVFNNVKINTPTKKTNNTNVTSVS